MAKAIRAWDVDFYFHDRFGSAERFWKQQDVPGRRGFTQMRFLEGRYKLWQRLNARFPGLLILNPGGHDFESMRTTHLTMAGRHTGDGNYSRYELAGLNWFYPSVTIQNDFIQYKDSYSEPYPLSSWLSRFPAMLGIGDPIGLWSPAVLAQGKKVVEVYKSIRHLLKTDFYPLFPQAQSLETWDGWQFHDSSSEEGMLAVFRLRYCDQASSTIRLPPLRKDRTYEFSDPFTDKRFTRNGRELVQTGLQVTLPANGAQLLRYRALKR